MAYGDIGAAEDTFEFELTDITRPEMIHISGDIYAIAFTDVSGYGQVVTIDITEAGAIGAAVKGSLEFDGAAGGDPAIIHIAGSVYAIAYKNSTNDGVVLTLTISDNGETLALTGQSVAFEETYGAQPDMVHVSGIVYAIAYTGAGNNGFIAAVNISDNGLTLSKIGVSLEYDEDDGKEPSLIHVSGDVFAIAHTGAGNNGVITTVTVSGAGVIALVAGGSLEFDGADGNDSCMVRVATGIFAIAYRSTGDVGIVKTVSISGAGAIALIAGGSLEFDGTKCTHPDIILLNKGICAIAYAGDGDDGYVCTIQVNEDGTVDDPILDVREHDLQNGGQPSIVRVLGDQYAIAYIGLGLDGFVDTPTIETPRAGGIKYGLLMGIG